MGANQTKSSESQTIRAKCLIVGQLQVGKTSLVQCYNNEEFSNDYNPTLGCNLKSFLIDYYGISVQLLVMDSLSDMDLQLECRLKSIKNADVIGLAFDLTNQSTFDDLTDKIDLLKKNEYRKKEILLIGTKADLEEREVSEEEIKKIIENESEVKITYMETSAKNGTSVNNTFMKAVEIGVGVHILNWERKKYFLWVYKKIAPPIIEEGATRVSWANICEAIPNMITKRNRRKEMPLYQLSPELAIKVSEYL